MRPSMFGRLQAVPLARCASGVLASCLLLGSCRNPSETVRGVRLVWYAAQNGWTQSRPAVTQDLAIFASGDGSVVARSVADGQLKWRKAFFAPGVAFSGESEQRMIDNFQKSRSWSMRVRLPITAPLWERSLDESAGGRSGCWAASTKHGSAIPAGARSLAMFSEGF